MSFPLHGSRREEFGDLIDGSIRQTRAVDLRCEKAQDGSAMHYTVDGISKKVEFHWIAGPTDTIYFNFYNQAGIVEHAEVWTR